MTDVTQSFPAEGLGRCHRPSRVRGSAPEAHFGNNLLQSGLKPSLSQAKKSGGGIFYVVPTKLKSGGGAHLWFPLCRGEAGLLVTPM